MEVMIDRRIINYEKLRFEYYIKKEKSHIWYISSEQVRERQI